MPFSSIGDVPGVALDEAGNLYVAHFGGEDVMIVTPKEELVEQISVEGLRPTKVGFGGSDRKTLYIAEVDTGSVYLFKTDYPDFSLYGDVGFKKNRCKVSISSSIENVRERKCRGML